MRVGVRRDSPAGAFDLEEIEKRAFQGAQFVSPTCARVRILRTREKPLECTPLLASPISASPTRIDALSGKMRLPGGISPSAVPKRS